jgi:hypothetical protein
MSLSDWKTREELQVLPWQQVPSEIEPFPGLDLMAG